MSQVEKPSTAWTSRPITAAPAPGTPDRTDDFNA